MINRDELLKMAREAGAFMNGTVHVHEGGTAFGFIQLDAFKDAILERAAVEFEEEWPGEVLYSSKASEIVRALKTQGE